MVGYDYEPLPGTETKVQFYNAGEEIKNPDGSVNQADTSTISETADQFTLSWKMDFILISVFRHRSFTIKH